MSAPASAARRWHPVLHRWPSVLGLAAAVGSLATGSDHEGVAITLTVAAVCYLSAAALGKPWIAWPAILGATLVVTVSELVGLPWWSGLAVVAVALVVIGLIRRAPRLALTAETVGLVGFGTAAVTALFLAPRVGLVVAGLALASHAVWDAVHLRRKLVVSPSMAEFCIFLDVPLGLGVIILAFIG